MTGKNSPKTFSFLKDLNIDQQVENLLAQNLTRIENGSDEVFVTPLGKNHNPDQLLEEWTKIYQVHEKQLNEPLRNLESSNLSKFGPRSIAVPWSERKELVAAYFGSGDVIDLARLATRNELVNGRLRPLSNDNAIKYLKNSTSSGLPYYAKKGRVKAEVLANFDQLIQRQDPCVMFTRTQEQKKTRTVWGYPIADTLFETKYYRPLLDIQRKQPWRAALVGPTQVDEKITNLIDSSIKLGHSLVSIDFSSYDATLKASLQKASFDYIKDCFQPSVSDDIEYISTRFRTIGIITPDGVWNGDHGVPSGSTFTNEVDSIAQYLCANSSELDLLEYQIQGDDGAYMTGDPAKLMQTFEDSGLKVNSEKSDISDKYLTYLQLLFHPDYRRQDGIIGGIYSTYRALTRLVYQERFDDFSEYEIEGSDFYAIRSLTILENCKHHPLFKDFVKFVLSKDKYGLKPTQKGIDQYVKMLEDKSGAEGIISNQYGDVVSGIRSFESYKLVMEQ